MICPACGREAPEQTNFCQFCGQPLTEQPLTGPASEPVSHATPLAYPSVSPYAGFWRRCFALIIDEIFISFVVVGAEAALSPLLGIDFGLGQGLPSSGKALKTVFGAKFLAATLIHWLYWAGLESSVKQATLGKMAIGIQVTDLKGEPISFSRATGRYFGKFISGILFGIGFLMAGWTEKKQALHDIMAGTLVVRRQD